MRVSIVYFLRNPKWGLIKIGTSYNIKARINDLSADTRTNVEFIGAFLGTFEDEKAVHEQFAEWRVACEWFHPADELLAYIKDNAYLTLDDTIQLHRSLKTETPTVVNDAAAPSALFGRHVNQQNIADQLNNLMHGRPFSREQAFEKWAAYKSLVIFEQIAWMPRTFEDAYHEVASAFGLDEKGQFRDHFGYVGDVWRDVERLLTSYLDRLPSPIEHEDESRMPKLTLEESADYLGISIDNMTRRVYGERKLSGTLGRDGVRRFSTHELEEWKANRPKQGRTRRM